MKKTLLTLCCLASAASIAFAAEPITETWSDWEAFTDPSTTATEKTSTDTNIKYTFMGAYVSVGYNGAANYLMVKGKATADAYVSFTLPFDCSKITLHTNSGSISTNSASKVTVYAGNDAITTIAVNVADKDFDVPIPAGKGAKGTVFKVQSATTKYNQQFKSFTYTPVSSKPTISLVTKELNFAAPANVSITKNIELAVENISDDINFATTGDVFSGSGSIGASDVAEGFPVTMKSATAGTFTGETTVSAEGVSAKVALKAVVVENEGTEANPLTVANVLALNNLYTETVYVTGIVNEKTAAIAKDGVITEAETASNSNIILKDAEGNMIPVALPTGDTRTALNIVDNPANVGKTVIVKGTLENYYGAPGVKNTVYVSGLEGSSIEDLNSDMDNADATYYNLQGVRVENPSNGVYIRVINNKAEKVVL